MKTLHVIVFHYAKQAQHRMYLMHMLCLRCLHPVYSQNLNPIVYPNKGNCMLMPGKYETKFENGKILKEMQTSNVHKKV